MIRAQILTTWSGDGSDTNPNHPSLQDDFQLASWTDVTGQPNANLKPSPNLFVIEVVADSTVIDAIRADANYGDESILWEEKVG